MPVADDSPRAERSVKPQVVVAAVVVVVLGLAAGLALVAQRSASHVLNGDVGVSAMWVRKCVSAKGAGIADERTYEPDTTKDKNVVGATVTVRDASGATVGVGTVGSLDGQWTGLHEVHGSDGAIAMLGQCRAPFVVAGVKGSSDFYSVEVAHRGPVSFSQGELDGNGWTVHRVGASN